MKGRMKMAEKMNGREKSKNKDKNWDKIKKEVPDENDAGDTAAEEELPAEDKVGAEDEIPSRETAGGEGSESGEQAEPEENCGKSEKGKKKSDKKGKDEENVTLTKKEADKILNKLAELNDKYLHVVAEYDNFRKRSQKEREGLYADAYAEALSALLPIADNLERAATYTDGDKIIEGVAMTLKQLSASLEKLGIESFGEPGDSFDPNLHNAIMHCEDDSLGENVIAEVFQHGYKKGDRVIRFAMVKVAN